MNTSLEYVLRPSSIAAIGASRQPATIGHQIVANLVSNAFAGPVYPVNPRATFIHSIRACRTVGAIPGVPDLAVIAVPRDAVPAVAEECGAAGVRGLVVISAGFKESASAAGSSRRRFWQLQSATACAWWVRTAWAC